jgi:hypothetical protein
VSLKQDQDFLRFLTMGAAGTADVLDALCKLHGHRMAELERYATANKIWAQKIKRLRLADLICLDCGMRVEVRTKSQLAIRMSHSEKLGREWDAGLRDQDLVAFVAWLPEHLAPSSHHHFFRVGDMRLTERFARHGPRKAASEGAERDMTWPATVPKKGGTLLEIDPSTGTARYQPDHGRRQTYRMQAQGASTYPYASPGQHLAGGEEFLFGTVPPPPSLQCVGPRWNFRADLDAGDPADRYAAVKAAGFGEHDKRLEQSLSKIASKPEEDARIRLEATGSLAKLDPVTFIPKLIDLVVSAAPGDKDEMALAMEAIFILSELGSAQASEALVELASNQGLEPEMRSAAVWGLGTAGTDDPQRLLPFIADHDDDVALHALAGIGQLDDHLRRRLRKMLLDGTDREAASAVGLLAEEGEPGIRVLLEAARREDRAGLWGRAALGRLPEATVRAIAKRLSPSLGAALAPMWIDQRSWMRSQQPPSAIDLLRQQTVRHLGNERQRARS